MCFKIAGGNELATVKVLMTMSFNSVVEEVFGIDLDAIDLNLRLHADLHMTQAMQEEFADKIADYFDGAQVDFEKARTLDDVFDEVVAREFKDLPEDAFSM